RADRLRVAGEGDEKEERKEGVHLAMHRGLLMRSGSYRGGMWAVNENSMAPEAQRAVPRAALSRHGPPIVLCLAHWRSATLRPSCVAVPRPAAPMRTLSAFQFRSACDRGVTTAGLGSASTRRVARGE